MNSNSQTHVSGDITAKKPNGKDVVSSAEPVKRVGQTEVSLATAVSGDSKSKKPNGKAVVSSSDEVLFFKDVKFEPQEGELRFRLIHFWEARNALTKVFFGIEFLLIDGQVYSDIYDFVLVLLVRSNTNIRCFCFLLSTGYCDPRVHPTKQD